MDEKPIELPEIIEKLSPKAKRLMASKCVSQVIHLLVSPRFQNAIFFSSMYARGKLSKNQLKKARRQAERDTSIAMTEREQFASKAAMATLLTAKDSETYILRVVVLNVTKALNISPAHLFYRIRYRAAVKNDGAIIEVG